MSILSIFGQPEKSDRRMDLIRHLQKMLAYQQLAMERVNDAMARATNSGTPTNEAFDRPPVTIFDDQATRELILPALRMKLAILNNCEKEHYEFPLPDTEPFASAFARFGDALEVLQERTRLQIDGFEAWVLGVGDVDTTRLDEDEMDAMDLFLAKQNDCMQLLEFDADKFLDILHETHNEVRQTIGLSPLPNAVFREKYLSGLSGKPSRFFNA